MKKGLGGMVVWDLSTDDFHGHCGYGKNPLISAMRAVLTNDDPNSPSFTPYPIPFVPTDPPCGKYYKVYISYSCDLLITDIA